MRSAGGTKSGPPCFVTRATKSVMDFFAGPAFQDGNESLCARSDAAQVSAGNASTTSANLCTPVRTAVPMRLRGRSSRRGLAHVHMLFWHGITCGAEGLDDLAIGVEVDLPVVIGVGVRAHGQD